MSQRAEETRGRNKGRKRARFRSLCCCAIVGETRRDETRLSAEPPKRATAGKRADGQAQAHLQVNLNCAGNERNSKPSCCVPCLQRSYF